MGDDKPYRGELNKPIPFEPAGLLWSDEQVSAFVAAFQSEQERRMQLLFEFFRVTPGDWETLCWKMAEKHVPGMRRQNPPGRPKIWHDYDRIELVIAVKMLREKTAAESDTHALSKLAKQKRWNALLSAQNEHGPQDPVERLQQELKRGKKLKRWIRVFEEARFQPTFDKEPEKSG
jgi:hypothetical protein